VVGKLRVVFTNHVDDLARDCHLRAVRLGQKFSPENAFFRGAATLCRETESLRQLPRTRSAPAGQGRDSGERSERTLDAPKRSRTIREPERRVCGR
jgi:hypothetical protein